MKRNYSDEELTKMFRPVMLALPEQITAYEVKGALETLDTEEYPAGFTTEDVDAMLLQVRQFIRYYARRAGSK